jgi:hypothetical protein
VQDDGDGSVTVSAADTDTRTDVSDDGNPVVSDVSDIDFGSNVSVQDDGDGSVTVSGSGGKWTKDGTETASSTYSLDYVLNSTYERVAVAIKVTNVGASSENVDFRDINGVSDFDYYDPDGTYTTGASDVPLFQLNDGYTSTEFLEIQGRFDYSANFRVGYPPDERVSSGKCDNLAANGTVSDFQIGTSSEPCDFTVTVWGLNF